MSAYQYGHQWKTERDRLADLELVLDPPTWVILSTLGSMEGWRCLDVGAGAGSVARWLCDRVGPGGYVVGTDLETGFLEESTLPNLEIRQHDIVSGQLETNSYDLIHARGVLEHLPEREVALANMVSGLKPGGVLVIQDADYISFVAQSDHHHELFDKGQRAFYKVISAAGWDLNFGRKTANALRRAGLVEVRMEVYAFEWGADLPGTLMWKYSFERFREKVISNGLLSEPDADAFLKLLNEPEFRAMSPLVCVAIGHKPGNQ